MWEWREDVGTTREPLRAEHGGWRLDHYGTWVWDPRLDPRLAEREARAERLRPAMAALPELATAGAPRPRGDLGHWEPTPIFRSVSSERDRHLRLVEATLRRNQGSTPIGIPEPHPGSGPLPVQEPYGRPAGRPQGRRLAPVETVPPPPAAHEPAESTQDELRRRAERRRRPRREPAEQPGGAGRHALRAVPADDRGRHSFR